MLSNTQWIDSWISPSIPSSPRVSALGSDPSRVPRLQTHHCASPPNFLYGSLLPAVWPDSLSASRVFLIYRTWGGMMVINWRMVCAFAPTPCSPSRWDSGLTTEQSLTGWGGSSLVDRIKKWTWPVLCLWRSLLHQSVDYALQKEVAISEGLGSMTTSSRPSILWATGGLAGVWGTKLKHRSFSTGLTVCTITRKN